MRWDFYPHDAKTSNNMAVSDIKQYHTLKPMLVETHLSVWKVTFGKSLHRFRDTYCGTVFGEVGYTRVCVRAVFNKQKSFSELNVD